MFRQSLTFLNLSPYHWLSDVVEKILERKVTTTVRPVRQNPASLSSIDAAAESVLHLHPFSDEFEVACALWAPLLPFGINSSRMISMSDICVYSVTFPYIRHQRGGDTAAALVLLLTENTGDLRRPNILNKIKSEKICVMSMFNFGHQSDVSNGFV